MALPNSKPSGSPRGKLILVVDDEPHLVRMVRMNLEVEGFRVIEARNGLQALEQIRTKLPDLVLLDVMMPELDGFATLKMLREFSSLPVIMLTAKGDENDRVRGLELGADDYLPKPFGPRELSARIRAVLRRAESTSVAPEDTVLTIDDYLQVDFNTRSVIVGGERKKLRPLEFRLLYHLIENAGWTVTYEQILANVWGYEYREETHYVRLYVNYLRKSIEPDPSNPRYILTERGVGYRFMDFRRSGGSR
ncbi:MAG: response regulator transcription factor, partial [Chloroflexi bacterium]|nr:response regulator transcription factor [Chloroflexota bacterium]